MIYEIQKQVETNIDQWTQATRRMSVRLIGFVISCWLVIGTIGIGLVVPVYLVNSMRHKATKEPQRNEGLERRQMGNISLGRGIQAKQSLLADRYVGYGQPARTGVVVKRNLQDTRDTVSELRSLMSGLSAFGKR